MKASPEQLIPAAWEERERHASRVVKAELRTKMVNFDKFSAHLFEDITNGERPSVAEGRSCGRRCVIAIARDPPDRWSTRRWKHNHRFGEPGQVIDKIHSC